MSLSNPWAYTSAAYAEFVKATGYKIPIAAYEKAFEAEWKTALDESRKMSKSSSCRASGPEAALIVQRKLIKYAKEYNHPSDHATLRNLIDLRLGFLLINLSLNQLKNTLPDPPEEVNITL